MDNVDLIKYYFVRIIINGERKFKTEMHFISLDIESECN